MRSLTVQYTGSEHGNAQLNASINSILNATPLLSMATTGKNLSYINTAYFSFDEKLELFILTPPSTQHSQNVARNPSVAVTVFDSTQPWDGQKRGLQLSGEGRKLEDRVEVVDAIALYTERFPSFGQWIKKPEDFDAGTMESRFYGILVHELTVFDEPAFGTDTFLRLKVRR